MLFVEDQIEKIIKLNPGEFEFHQSVIETLKSIETFLELNPIYKENSIIERITEPDRQIKFRVAWRDDSGRIQVNRGFRVQFNNAVGPYKGGLRFHPSVNIGIIKFLAFEQTFKNALTGLPIGGGKGGSDFDPKGKSDNEIMSFCQSFMTELFRHIGPETDIPAGDIGVGAREIGYLFGQYKRIKNVCNGTFTGKGLIYGGSLVRKEATGYGLLYLTEELLKKHGDSVQKKLVSISGAGNVAIHAAEKAQQLGAKVITMSDSKGWIYDSDGICLETVKRIKENNRRSLIEYKKHHPKSEYYEGIFDWRVPCEIALPCATQNELPLEGAKNLVKNGVLAILEGSNMSTTIDATKFLQKNKVLYVPGKASNSGGVATSVLEMSQNSLKLSWDFDEVNTKLKQIMKNIFVDISQTAEEYGDPENYLCGANIAGFKKVAKAMLAQGVV